jgi:MoxR-like ATPase
MQERQVTVDGKAHKLPDPFLVIATQNPYEHRDVFELPESQLDRFLFKLQVDYSDAQSEYEMLDLPHKGVAPDMLGEVRPLLGVVGLDRARDELDATELPEEVGRYMVAVARGTRNVPGVELGVSSRGVIHLASAARANARLNGRDEVTVADVREIAPYVLRHRLIVDETLTPDDVLERVLEQVPAPQHTYSLR